jgi:hypothetical protein
MLCWLHTVYKIIHCVALYTLSNITECLKSYSKMVNLLSYIWKNLHLPKKNYRAPPVAPVTNIRYGQNLHHSRSTFDQSHMPRSINFWLIHIKVAHQIDLSLIDFWRNIFRRISAWSTFDQLLMSKVEWLQPQRTSRMKSIFASTATFHLNQSFSNDKCKLRGTWEINQSIQFKMWSKSNFLRA